MVQINADKEEAEVVRVKVEAEEATANEKVRRWSRSVWIGMLWAFILPGSASG